MKAVTKVKEGFDNVELLDIDEPRASGYLVKIQVGFVGICGSDILTFKGDYNKAIPIVLGHEFSGIVTEIGEKVTTIKVGDRVTSETTFSTCGKCEYCKNKEYNLCSHRQGLGTQIYGAMAKYVLSREESVHILPDSISLKSAALCEPLACGVHAVYEKSSVKKGDICLVIGPGPIGILLAQALKTKDAFVIISGTHRDVHRLELAKKLGVDMTINIDDQDLENTLMELTNRRGVDLVFECSGIDKALNQALPLVKKKGEIIQLGLFANKLISIDHEAILHRELAFIGSRSSKPSTWKITLDLMERGLIDTEALVSRIVNLENWRDGFNYVMEGQDMKVLIKPSNTK